MWTFAAVEARLVEAMLLWRRTPGGGASPFASDGPWELVKAELYGPDVDKDAPIRAAPLSRAEVAERDAASALLTWLGEEERRVVVAAVRQLAGGRKRVDWTGMKRAFGIARGAGALARRYERAVGFLAMRLNGVAERRARALLNRGPAAAAVAAAGAAPRRRDLSTEK